MLFWDVESIFPPHCGLDNFLEKQTEEGFCVVIQIYLTNTVIFENLTKIHLLINVTSNCQYLLEVLPPIYDELNIHQLLSQKWPINLVKVRIKHFQSYHSINLGIVFHN